MAVAALSMSAKDSSARLDALDHYQRSLPALQASLKGPADLSSDGAFLTHFLLLIYEVCFTQVENAFADSCRLLQLKRAMRICGLNICPLCCEYHCCDAKSLAVSDIHSSFGGFA